MKYTVTELAKKFRKCETGIRQYLCRKELYSKFKGKGIWDLDEIDLSRLSFLLNTRKKKRL